MRKNFYPRLHVLECVCEDDVEDAVGAAALLVHVGGGYCTRLVALGHQRLNVLHRKEASLTPLCGKGFVAGKWVWKRPLSFMA